MNNHANISPSQPAHVEEEILRLGNAFFPVRALPDYCCKGKIVLPHWHSFLEILFIKTGIMDLNVNGRSYMLHSGDIMLINQYDVHGISDNPCTFEFLQVEAGFLTTFGIQQIGRAHV